MGTITENKDFRCSVCGQISAQPVITEQDRASGAPDLDLRPAGAQRNNMRYWAMKCPECGYCCTTLDIPFDDSREYLESDEYKTCGGITVTNEYAERLIKRALVFVRDHTYKDAVRSYLAAAWALDDDKDDRHAKECRLAAVKLMDGHPAAFKGDNNFLLLKADLLRRAGDFERVVREFAGKAFHSQIMTAIAFFEVHLSASGDSAAHRADEVPGVSAASQGD